MDARIVTTVKTITTVKTNILNDAYINVASASILVFDYFLTLSRERDLIWNQPFSILTFLFLVTRYLPFIDTAAAVYDSLAPNPSEHGCLVAYQIQAACYFVGMSASECILLMRTAAVWDNKKGVFQTLGVLLFLVVGTSVFLVEKYIGLNTSVGLSISIDGFDVPTGCPPVTGSSAPLIAGPFILLLAFETVLICLMLPKAFHHREIGKTGLYQALYTNGFRFYIFAFVVSVANITVLFYPFHTQPAPVDLLQIDRVLHAIFAERLLFAIRGAFDERTKIPSTLPTVQFHDPGPHFEEESAQYAIVETLSTQTVLSSARLV